MGKSRQIMIAEELTEKLSGAPDGMQTSTEELMLNYGYADNGLNMTEMKMVHDTLVELCQSRDIIIDTAPWEGIEDDLSWKSLFIVRRKQNEGILNHI